MSGSCDGSVVQPLNDRRSDGSATGPSDEQPSYWLDKLLKQDAIAALAASEDALTEELAANVVAMARLAIVAYLDTRAKDGACAGCFLARLSLSLEGEGWELGQDLKVAVHATDCRRDYEVP